MNKDRYVQASWGPLALIGAVTARALSRRAGAETHMINALRP